MGFSKRKAQWWLAGVWLSAFCALSILLLFQVSMTSMYADKTKQVWDWFLPATAPTLGLMIATLVGGPQGTEQADVEKGIFFLALALSLGYLLLLGVLIAIVGLRYSWAPIENSAPLLAVIQGFVTLAIGAFFVRGKSSTSK